MVQLAHILDPLLAELVLCEIIALSRQLGDRNMESHAKKWSKVNHAIPYCTFFSSRLLYLFLSFLFLFSVHL